MDYLIEYHAFYLGVRVIRTTLRVILLSAVASLIIPLACLGYPFLLLAAYLGNRHHNWFKATHEMLSRTTFQWLGFNFSLFMAVTGFVAYKALAYAGVGSFASRNLGDSLTWGAGLLVFMLTVFLYAKRTKVNHTLRQRDISKHSDAYPDQESLGLDESITRSPTNDIGKSGNSNLLPPSKVPKTMSDAAQELNTLISRLAAGEDLAAIRDLVEYVRTNGADLVSGLEDKRRIDFLMTAPHPLDVILYDKVVDAHPGASMRFLIDLCQEFASTQTVYASIEEAEAAGRV